MVPDLTSRRLGVLAALTAVLFATLGARLYFLQVMQPTDFEELVAGNRIREITTEAPRGRILDAEGRTLAGIRESLVVTLDWTVIRDLDDEEQEEVFAGLAAELSEAGIKSKAESIERIYRRAVDGTLKPVVVADDVGEAIWVRLSESGFTGIDVERQWVRTYPYGSVGAHILGYTSSVRDAEQAAELTAASDKSYLPGDEIGIAGLERTYEPVLRGVPEIRRVEVDAKNRVVRTVEIVQEAVPGDDVVLSLNVDLQYAAEQILLDELEQARDRPSSPGSREHVADSGALVALDVTDGSVIALASYPTFDPRDFIFGISGSLWSELSERSDEPLLDRTLRGDYPAGSTFKPFVAYAAQEAGVRGQYDAWVDEGVYVLESCSDPDDRSGGCRFQNAGAAVLGTVELREALERSSDTYFYSIGERFWTRQDEFGRTGIQDVAAEFGFGAAPGIDLPSQFAGRLPTPEGRVELYGEDARWFPGDNVNLSIGQGELSMTPLQLTNAYAQLATGGVRYEPRLVDRILPSGGAEPVPVEPVVAADLDLDPELLAPIYDGLLAVVDDGLGVGRGTAIRAFDGFPLASYPIAGKTGTAEVVRQADYALFAGFGPWPEPKYSVAAVLEQAGFGGDAAAPAVRRFFEYLAGVEPIPPAPVAEERILDVASADPVDFAAFDEFSVTLPESEDTPVTAPPEPVPVEPRPDVDPDPPAPRRTTTTAPPPTTSATTAPTSATTSTTQPTTSATTAPTSATTSTTQPTTSATSATTTTTRPPTSATSSDPPPTSEEASG